MKYQIRSNIRRTVVVVADDDVRFEYMLSGVCADYVCKPSIVCLALSSSFATLTALAPNNFRVKLLADF
jgi:hypothetical protein